MRKNTKNSIKLVLTLVALISYFLPWIASWPDSATIWYAGDSLRMLGGLTGSTKAQAVGVVLIALLNTIIMAILIMVTGKETYNVWTVSAWPIISASACLLGIFF